MKKKATSKRKKKKNRTILLPLLLLLRRRRKKKHPIPRSQKDNTSNREKCVIYSFSHSLFFIFLFNLDKMAEADKKRFAVLHFAVFILIFQRSFSDLFKRRQSHPSDHISSREKPEKRQKENTRERKGSRAKRGREFI